MEPGKVPWGSRKNPNKSLPSGGFTSLAGVAFRRRHFRLNRGKLLAGIRSRGDHACLETLEKSKSVQQPERDTMKRFLLGTVGLIALGMAAPASAADLAARPYTKAPPPVAPVYDWTGFYIGANGGWGSSRNCWDSVAPAFPVGREGCHDADGGVVGGQIGYRWQTAGWVFGLEGQGDWADLRGSNESELFPGFRNRSRIDAFGLFTGQIGYAWNNVLFYVKGGGAVTDNRFDIRTIPGDVIVGRTGDETRWGGTVGVGFEYGFYPGVSVGVEYDHLFMQDKTLTFTDATGGFFGADRIKQDVDLVTVRLNYRFGGPVIGKY
jgi:outer membrane immunogenic protein